MEQDFTEATSRGFVRGYAIQLGRRHRLGRGSDHDRIQGHLALGADHHRVFRKLNGHPSGASAIGEDVPEEHNRVTLEPVV